MNWFQKAFEIKDIKPEGLTEKERAVLEKLAVQVHQRGMGAPAIIFLESVKPLGFMAGQVMVFFRPFISAFFKTQEYDLLSDMLEERNTVEMLLNRIEALEQKADRKD
jgi:hypothetical protein